MKFLSVFFISLVIRLYFFFLYVYAYTLVSILLFSIFIDIDPTPQSSFYLNIYRTPSVSD